MVDVKRIPLPPIPPGPLTGETLRGVLDAYHRYVIVPHAHEGAGGPVDAGDVTGLDEAIDDRVAALLVAGPNVSLTYNDGANTLTVGASGGGGGGGGSSYFPGGW